MAAKASVDEFSKNKHYILVIRSPWNHLASILSWKPRWYMKKKERFIKGWNASAKEYLGITNILPSPKTFINYDKWFLDIEYRRSISKQLNIPFSDRGLNIVLPIGWGKTGSSFDRMAYGQNAQDMNVLNRWKKYKKNKAEFIEVLKFSKGLRELSQRIYGDFPEGL